MRRTLTRLLTGCIAFVILGVTLATSTHAAVTNWQKSANIRPRSSTDFSSATFQQSLRDLKAMNANSVTLVIPYYQNSVNSTDIFRGPNTPTDQSLIDAITYAHSIGLQVTLIIHMEAFDTFWRAHINPSNRAAWFASYESVLTHYARLAQTHRVEGLILGAEMINMASDYANPTNSSYWRPMIDRLRAIYSGKLSYSAQRGYGADNDWYNEMENVKFWDKLDYIGLSGYYELDKHTSNPTATGIQNWWTFIERDYINPFQQQQNKPIQFTEIGYRSADGTNQAPWDWTRGGAYDPADQSLLYDQLFAFWNSKGYFGGIHIWDWSSDPNAGGQGNTDYTPQNKPAEAVIAQWFQGGATPAPSPSPTSSPTPSTSPNPSGFTITAQSVPTSPTVNTQSQLNTRVASNNPISNAIVDIEVYNSANQRVHQQFFENQNLSSTATNFNVLWTPRAIGTYTVKVGIFSSGWSQLYRWEDNSLTFNVVAGGTSTPTPTPTTSPSPTATPSPAVSPTATATPRPSLTPSPTPTSTPIASSELEVWWPTHNATIGGTLPFKAILQNTPLDQYKMFWQVDGGIRNEMYNNLEDYPHKEAWVNVSGWNWRGNGPYTLTFVAVPTNGSEVKKDIKVTISR